MKIFERIVDGRIREVVKPSDNQCGFLADSGAIDGIYTAPLLVEKKSRLKTLCAGWMFHRADFMLYKKGDMHDIGNDRPICLLSVAGLCV
ncbi:unnamed protein product [Heligmosomoides polygyrus]|uniref:Phage protein n=1 Tax=Heligmosomoides polygyrus TaxID=6339 RepID=A0A183GFU6_HELPZ|nr:unnamed protein product [Heligmosomoides polygyrus]